MEVPVPALPRALERRAAFQRVVVGEVAAAVGRDVVVVVGMGWNPHVRRARRWLEERQVPYTYLGYGNYLTGWKPRLAIKIWAGWPTFPMIFLHGRLVGGASDLRRLGASAEWASLVGSTAAVPAGSAP